MALAILIMGVSGSGKTTVGQALARATGATFLEGDDFHSAENKAKMSAGIALDDKDREPWLDALGTALGRSAAAHDVALAACSALKVTYRARLADAAKMPVHLIFLHGDAALLAARMRGRSGHFMPVSLLESQIATLEPPVASEDALVLDIARPLQALVDEAHEWIEARRG
jgi:gluconokinase